MEHDIINEYTNTALSDYGKAEHVQKTVINEKKFAKGSILSITRNRVKYLY
jgi:hypothetical protein